MIGLEGEIIQCIPTWEMAYATNDRNVDTISIDVVIRMRMESLLMQHTAHLYNLQHGYCAKYDLTADQVIRHYDVTGKICRNIL